MLAGRVFLPEDQQTTVLINLLITAESRTMASARNSLTRSGLADKRGGSFCVRLCGFLPAASVSTEPTHV